MLPPPQPVRTRPAQIQAFWFVALAISKTCLALMPRPADSRSIVVFSLEIRLLGGAPRLGDRPAVCIAESFGIFQVRSLAPAFGHPLRAARLRAGEEAIDLDAFLFEEAFLADIFFVDLPAPLRALRLLALADRAAAIFSAKPPPAGRPPLALRFFLEAFPLDFLLDFFPAFLAAARPASIFDRNSSRLRWAFFLPVFLPVAFFVLRGFFEAVDAEALRAAFFAALPFLPFLPRIPPSAIQVERSFLANPPPGAPTAGPERGGALACS